MEIKKKKKIKEVYRIGLPETNLSSSHSVSICMKDSFIMPGDPRFNLEIKDNGDTLYIPSYQSGGFGWEVERYNDPKTKLQYVCGIYCSDIQTHRGITRITKLRRLLCDILGVKKVEFEWDMKFFDELKELRKSEPGKSMEYYQEEIYRDYPEINHNSTDIFDEIIESQETIKHFIFNPDSWLYLGNDNSSYPGHFFDASMIDPLADEPEYRGSIELGGNIGRLDFNIPYSITSSDAQELISYCEELYDILSTLHYSAKEGVFKSDTSVLNYFTVQDDLTLQHSNIFSTEDGGCFMMFNNKKFDDCFRDFWMKIEKKENKRMSSRSVYTFDSFLKEDLEKKYKLKKDRDYKFFEVHIESDKYGKIA